MLGIALQLVDLDNDIGGVCGFTSRATRGRLVAGAVHRTGLRAVTGGRILVVDDEPLVLNMLREIVEHMGHEASTAASAEQAIAAMATVRPHVVFLDIRMPGMSGLEALTYFRENHPAVQVIVITGSKDLEISRQARAAGAFAVVGKPFDLDALRIITAQAMELALRT